ncbi:MAG: hypothetical protein PHR16_08390 [Methylovulum sp.]|nr:hypothetical protein [Methylovulum sp.]
MKNGQHSMIKLPEISEASTRAEMVEWLAAAHKLNNDLWAKAIARDKLKKAQQPRTRG